MKRLCEIRTLALHEIEIQKRRTVLFDIDLILRDWSQVALHVRL